MNILRTNILAVLAAATISVAAVGPAEAGCSTLGYGGTVVDSVCTYTAEDEFDNVYVVSPHYWEVRVKRQCPLLSDTCREGAEACTDPCEPLYQDNRCDEHPDNQCAQATDASGAPKWFERELLLGSGTDESLVGQPLAVHTKPGDFVVVRLEADQSGTGPYGYITVGEDEDNLEPLGVDPP